MRVAGEVKESERGLDAKGREGRGGTYGGDGCDGQVGSGVLESRSYG